MPLSVLYGLIQDHYSFALARDYSDDSEHALFWYASEEKLEPRLGRRFEEPGADREHPLAIARDVAALAHAIEANAIEANAIEQESDSEISTAEFLLASPEHRHVVRRIQQIKLHPYAEIADNLIADGMLPIDLLRCKLAFFGAVKFDPRSDRWLRITLFQHAPLITDLTDKGSQALTNNGIAVADTVAPDLYDSWVYPPVKKVGPKTGCLLYTSPSPRDRG